MTAAWFALFLMLFNVVNAGGMGMRQMAALPDGEMPLCVTHPSGLEHHQHHTPAPAGSSDCCSCCLSMCCTGAALPDSLSVLPAPSLAWTSLTFASVPAFRLNPAPRTGGNARDPPVFV